MIKELCLVITPFLAEVACTLPRAGVCSVVLEPLLPLNSMLFGDRDSFLYDEVSGES
jgi:hypothetical protein